MQLPSGEVVEHGVVLRVIATNICGTDLHMYRGHYTASKGQQTQLLNWREWSEEEREWAVVTSSRHSLTAVCVLV